MSHFSCVRTKMTNVDLIQKACQSLGLQTEKNSYVRGWRRACTPAQLVIRMESGYDLGFALSGDGSYHAVADFAYTHAEAEHGGNLQTLWQQILSRYKNEEILAAGQTLGSTAKVTVCGI